MRINPLNCDTLQMLVDVVRAIDKQKFSLGSDLKNRIYCLAQQVRRGDTSDPDVIANELESIIEDVVALLDFGVPMSSLEKYADPTKDDQ